MCFFLNIISMDTILNFWQHICTKIKLITKDPTNRPIGEINNFINYNKKKFFILDAKLLNLSLNIKTLFSFILFIRKSGNSQRIGITSSRVYWAGSCYYIWYGIRYQFIKHSITNRKGRSNACLAATPLMQELDSCNYC